MTVAVQRVAPFVLSHYQLVRLDSPVFAWNPPSMRVLEKAGFVRESVRRGAVFTDGRTTDEVLYALVDPTQG